MANKKKKPVQMAKINSEDGWFNGKEIVPFQDLSDRHLQNAILNAERQELYLFNRYSLFGRLVEKLTEEAERRNLEVRHHKSKFTYKTHLKKRE